ncbi:hypothetical protein M422DRAFT_250472 [Sphaerobolus stellatus SS14]|uniref:Uncharacterized protein n=1 Tax=Sphaerobolus stellatus (strain SS14) TaxID=990650 RepID=A0A0C9VGA3_SPHS4|nr:hypothetical protein M422DRAFT_250472 [Sphaerobolus stellatus SS14]
MPAANPFPSSQIPPLPRRTMATTPAGADDQRRCHPRCGWPGVHGCPCGLTSRGDEERAESRASLEHAAEQLGTAWIRAGRRGRSSTVSLSSPPLNNYAQPSHPRPFQHHALHPIARDARRPAKPARRHAEHPRRARRKDQAPARRSDLIQDHESMKREIGELKTLLSSGSAIHQHVTNINKEEEEHHRLQMDAHNDDNERSVLTVTPGEEEDIDMDRHL